MEAVQILLSTYNGEKYLVDQLNSIKWQSYRPLEVLIRDDGSTDRTLEILEGFIKANVELCVRFVAGNKVGVIRSFLDLLASSDEVEFFAFCDQDDYWKQEKLSAAVAKLQAAPRHIPVMFCSRTELVDSELNKLGIWPALPERGAGLGNALVQNIAVGCTIVLNKAARDCIIKKQVDDSKLIMHDWWIYLCVSAFGIVIFDQEPGILYRQHGNNAMGGSTGLLQRLKKRMNNFKKNGFRQRYKEQAMEFYRLYATHLEPDKKRLLENFMSKKNFIERIRFAFSGEVYRQSKIGDALLKLLIVLGRH
jgi:glycosyltransferase involved in cell wall biosynthesis